VRERYRSATLVSRGRTREGWAAGGPSARLGAAVKSGILADERNGRCCVSNTGLVRIRKLRDVRGGGMAVGRPVVVTHLPWGSGR
jgi:hypothetical protein